MWRCLTAEYLEKQIDLAELVSRSNQLFGISVSVPTATIEQLVQGDHTAEEAYALRENAALKAQLTQQNAEFQARLNALEAAQHR